MKNVLAALAFASSLVPTLALACPTYAERSCCGSSNFGQYASTFGVGLLIGVGSMAVESALRARSRRKK